MTENTTPMTEAVQETLETVTEATTAKVDETTIEFESSGPATNEFHISKPSGWPKGDYKVEVFLNDSPAPATTRTFKVG